MIYWVGIVNADPTYAYVVLISDKHDDDDDVD